MVRDEAVLLDIVRAARLVLEFKQDMDKARLPDGQVLEISMWRDVLRECCKFALAHNASIAIPFPDRVGRKVWLFSHEKPAKKVSFVTEQYNGNKIYIYLNYDSHNSVANALYVLRQVPKEFLSTVPAIVLRK